jgi:acyl-CoA thioester hydrolase
MTIDASHADPDLPGLFFSPFVSSAMRVEEAWIDYNGHMNLAFYATLFDRAMDEAMALCGLGPDYVARRGHSFFLVESRISYRQELNSGDSVRVTLHLLDVDDKRVLFYLEARHAKGGWIAASAEMLALHINMALRKAAPFPADVRQQLDDLRRSHEGLARPDTLGRGVTMPQKRMMN